MDHKRMGLKQKFLTSGLAALMCIGAIVLGAPRTRAQGPGTAAPAAGPVKLEIVDGSSALYRVQEQLAGIDFPNQAEGSSSAVTGTIVIGPDGSVDSAHSKLSFDLRTLKSDQEMRDGYIQKRTLETDKFPTAEFVPRRIQGLAGPLPVTGQSGVKLIGDMTIHGVTKETTWNGIITFSKDGVAGRAATDFVFATFGLTKPTLARLLSVDDKIHLEIAFKMKRS